MKFCVVISIVPILFSVVCSNAVRTVVYRDGNALDSFEDDDFVDDWSPRAEYGAFASQRKGASLPLSKEKSRVIVANKNDVVIILRGESDDVEDYEDERVLQIPASDWKKSQNKFNSKVRKGLKNRFGTHKNFNPRNWQLTRSDFSDELSSSEELDDSDVYEPPPHQLVAKMARYIVHNSYWSSLATISTMPAVRGYPFVNLVSLSDGPNNNSTGIPYFYMTSLDMSSVDLESDNRASLMMTLAQTDFCEKHKYDPEDPRCAHVILSGRIVQVTNKAELAFASNAMFSQHPEMKDWPKDHGWFFAKLELTNVVVLDYFGGAVTVKLDDYFKQTLLA
ncbi:Protein CREG1 [Orchesella cincta]|uniref:Protein CREG1 n=1 Tax=Orchesella cincta TaxID=48709 RepID=A0A1D2MJN5_ORCCI|nr:Protein CREG1 [Orchesella cincta]